MKTGFLISILLGATVGLAYSQSGEEDHLFEQANQYYLDGNYDSALESYLKVHQAGYSSPSLFYNIGNTYYKLAEIPSSILYYERALLLKPHDEDIVFNLELANQRIVDRINPVPDFIIKRWIGRAGHVMDFEKWSLLSLALFVLTLLLISVLYGFRGIRFRRIILFITITSFLASGIAFYFARAESNRVHRSESAILFSPTVTVKSTPDPSGPDLFILHEGTKIEVKDHVGEWIEIRIADGNRGWIPVDAVIMI